MKPCENYENQFNFAPNSKSHYISIVKNVFKSDKRRNTFYAH